MNQEFIKLEKRRDFGDLMSATFNFVRQEFRYLFKALLVYILPFAIIGGILGGYFIDNIFYLMEEPASSEMPEEFALVLLVYPFMILMILFIYLVTYAYLAEYYDNGPQVELNRIHNRIWSNFWGFFGLGFLVGIIVIIGTLFLFIPGIYLGIALSLAFSIKIFENTSIGDAIGRSFKLIKNYWWQTLGLSLIMGLIGSIINSIFLIPAYVIIAINAFFAADGGSNSIPVPINALAVTLSIFSYVITSLTIIVIAFQYFNIKERKEGTSLTDRIDQMEMPED